MLAGANDLGSVNKSDLLPKLEEALNSLDPSDTIIFDSLDTPFEFEFTNQTPYFSNRYDASREPLPFDNDYRCSGYLKVNNRYIPVFRVPAHADAEKGFLLIFSVSKFGKMVQYSPVASVADNGHLFGLFDLRILNFNDDRVRGEILAQNLPWLMQNPDPEGFLRSRVWIKVFEAVEFEIENGGSGFKVRVIEPPGEE
jgi:hypothetical protein